MRSASKREGAIDGGLVIRLPWFVYGWSILRREEAWLAALDGVVEVLDLVGML